MNYWTEEEMDAISNDHEYIERMERRNADPFESLAIKQSDMQDLVSSLAQDPEYRDIYGLWS